MQSIQTVLILAPHTDDAELGCGGTIARFLEEGKKMYVAAFSTARAS
ncbi:MAG: PIG-L family deacetylase, partial [Bacteroidia bacterium]|nr:PIG-L family deacetylase [Bacteroidia bacterium]